MALLQSAARCLCRTNRPSRSLGAILVACLVLCLHAASAKQHRPADLYLLVRTYAPGYCKPANANSKCTRDTISAFTIHGLWPEYDDGTWPEYCNSSKPGARSRSAASAAPSLEPALECEWPSATGPDEEFHDHEWDRHGTCAEQLVSDKQDFFQAVLDLNAKYDLNVALNEVGIVPSDSDSYSRSSIIAAIRGAYKTAPVLRCHGKWLEEVQMCLDLQLEPVTCPDPVLKGANCPASVRLAEGDSPIPSSCSSFFPEAPEEVSVLGLKDGSDVSQA